MKLRNKHLGRSSRISKEEQTVKRAYKKEGRQNRKIKRRSRWNRISKY